MKKILYSFLAIVLGLVLSGAGCNQDAYDPDTYDVGVEINGVTWATRDVGEFGKFVAKPEDEGVTYYWNNKNYENLNYWEAAHDPCPSGWKVPTDTQMNASFPSGQIVRTTISGINGAYLGTAPNQIFLKVEGGAVYWNSINRGYAVLLVVGTDLYSAVGTNAGATDSNKYRIRCVKI